MCFQRKSKVFLLIVILLCGTGLFLISRPGPAAGEGSVEVQGKDIEVTAQRITMEQKQDLLTAEGAVHITRGSLQLQGEYAKLNRNQEHLLVQDDVYLEDNGELKLWAVELEGFLAEERYVARGQVQIEREDARATADRASYRADEGVLVLTGDPRVVQEGNVLTGEKITFFLNESRLLAEGNPRVVVREREGEGGE